jgi:16S rRNA (cytosine967-C5)-methyltransferase
MTSSPVRPALLALGCAALERILVFRGPADTALNQFFKLHPQLGRSDRGFIAETVFALLRRLRYFTHITGARHVRSLFIAAADALPPAARRELAPALSEEEKRWLADLRPDGFGALPLGVQADLPDWMIDRLTPSLSREQILSIGTAMQAPAPLDLRVNTQLITREEVRAALRDSGIFAQLTQYSPFGLRVAGKPALESHPLFRCAKVEVQDEGSQLLGLLLAPRRREMVVDFCAGAGGKTLLLGQLMRSEGRIYALDIAERRILRLRKRVARARLRNVHPEAIAHENDPRLERLAGKIDRVLIDAPCSGTGTLRRSPDLKWRQSDSDVAALQAKQASILEAAARLPKVGGRIQYATCSVLPQENDQIVDAFLARHPQFAELDCGRLLRTMGIELDCGKRLRLLPHVHGTDGFFAAMLEHRASESIGPAA